MEEERVYATGLQQPIPEISKTYPDINYYSSLVPIPLGSCSISQLLHIYNYDYPESNSPQLLEVDPIEMA